jgi:glyoxylase-like metal-dependent hydrolase (beta-lactamase superfamily II)
MHRVVGGWIVALALASGAYADATDIEQPHVIPGGFSRGMGPDGNTIIYRAADGLVVVDTGRHPGHSQVILDYAAKAGAPIVKIVNTHWHLDHTTGNQDLKAKYPKAKIYTTRAIEGALTGFLARGVTQSETMLKDPTLTDAQRAELTRGIKTIKERRGLLPDVAVEGPMKIAVDGGDLELLVTDRAVTASDIWIWDAARKTVVAGDLVVLPVPFFDTACPEQWSLALSDIAKKPFETLIPGHGEKINRAAFDRYRAAFDKLLACAADANATDCDARWVADAGDLVKPDEAAMAREFAAYYVKEIIRSKERRAEFCGAPSKP